MKLEDRKLLNKLAGQRKKLIVNLAMIGDNSYKGAVITVDFFSDGNLKLWKDNYKMDLSSNLRLQLATAIKTDLEENRNKLKALGVTVEDEKE